MSHAFCGSCDECFSRSFASHPKAEFWSDKNDDLPRNVALNSNKSFYFDCNDCNNELYIPPSRINKGS